MEQRYGTDPSSRYGTGVWNGCGPGPCSGPSILTCTHVFTNETFLWCNFYPIMVPQPPSPKTFQGVSLTHDKQTYGLRT